MDKKGALVAVLSSLGKAERGKESSVMRCLSHYHNSLFLELERVWDLGCSAACKEFKRNSLFAFVFPAAMVKQRERGIAARWRSLDALLETI